jgi:hypothetical protein
VNGLAQPEIGAAAAQIVERLVDLNVGRVRDALQQIDHGHDLAGLAIAALRDILIDPRLLNRVQRVAIGQPLDRHHRATGDRRHRHDAGPRDRAIDMHRARPANTAPASEFRALEPGFAAQIPEQRHVFVAAERTLLSVDGKPHGGLPQREDSRARAPAKDIGRTVSAVRRWQARGGATRARDQLATTAFNAWRHAASTATPHSESMIASARSAGMARR